MIHQVEFLIEGYLMPPTIGRMQITDTLILEQVYGSHSENPISAIAYIGVITPSATNFFPIARDTTWTSSYLYTV